MAEPDNISLKGWQSSDPAGAGPETIIQITPQDFELVGEVAAHCDTRKLKIAVREAVIFEMERIYCEFWQTVEANWNSTEARWRDLIDGSTYTGCKEKPRRHNGIKEALIYYAYARYIVLNGYNDTPSGHVTKTNDFSMPKPLKELQQFSDKYRNMGKRTVEKIENFLCTSSAETYPEFNRRNCKPCGCAGECGEKGNTKGHGIRSKNIGKWDAES